MPALYNRSKERLVASDVIVAKYFLQRAKGLLGFKSLDEDRVMWIHHCNSIHTWFMNFTIDAVFVDRNLEVKAIYHNVRPWRMTWPVFSASSVFEFAAGQAQHHSIEIGDQLDVGD